MNGAALGFIGRVTRSLALIYDTFDTTLTAGRANAIDNLQYLGLPQGKRGDINFGPIPVALQQYLGTATDPPGLTTSVFAALQQVAADLSAMEDDA